MRLLISLSAFPPLAFLEHFLNYRQREIFYAVAAILGILLLFATWIYGMILLQRYYRRKAAERSTQLQAALGSAFTFTAENPSLYLEMLRQTSTTLRGQNISLLSNRFSGPFQDGHSMQVMEAGYQVRTGKGGRYTVWQTIAHVGDQDWHFPPFSIKPRGFWSRLGLGGRGIRFDGHPKFGALFKVKCEDEAAARTFLTPALLDALDRFPGLTIEGRGNNLLIFRRRKALPAAEFLQFQQDARTLAALLPPTVGQPVPYS